MRAHARRIQHLQTEIADHDVLSGTIALDVVGESDFEATLPLLKATSVRRGAPIEPAPDPSTQ